MNTLLRHLVITVLTPAFCGICCAGPSVVSHPKAPSVKIWDDKFVVVQELKDPRQIKIVQDAFLRAKRVGDTASNLKTPTHKIDFSDRWLIDFHSGEIGVLSKMVTDVYQIAPKDLIAFKRLIAPKAADRGDGDKPPN